MAVWTTPKTFNVGDVLAAADLNTYLRDNLKYLGEDDIATTSPPASPVTGQRWIYQIATGEEWEFIRRNDLDATDPWHFIGGPPIAQNAQGAGAIASYTTPRAGTWRCIWGGRSIVSTGGGPSVSFQVGGVEKDNAATGLGNGTSGAGTYDTGHIASGTVIRTVVGGANNTGGSASLAVFPLKIA